MKTPSSTKSVVLSGLESAGKSTLFSALSRRSTGDEANFRGSTVTCRRCHLEDCECELVDTPGIRTRDDALTTRTALDAASSADVVLLVARGTHAVSEVETLLRELDLRQKRTALAITFKDKAPAAIHDLAGHYRRQFGIPVVVVDARRLDDAHRSEVLAAIAAAAPLRDTSEETDAVDETAVVNRPALLPVQPPATVFEHPVLGAPLAVLFILAMFGLPVYAAYVLAEWVQPMADAALIDPLKASLAWLPEWAAALLTGGYGLLTLGWYSFLWAFPVVAFLSLFTAIAEETGLKDRVTAALDPWLRHIGLHGRDLIPVLSGFGCNVVAVFQTRSCSSCTRRQCVSMIAFGSACSYQIGATLSIFSAAGHPGLFLPCLLALFFVGAIHNRLWHGPLAQAGASPLHERAFLQKPSATQVGWRVRATLRQFLFQAMPVFLLICLVAAALEYAGVLGAASTAFGPLLMPFQLPPEVAPAILFSILRKDGLLTLNADDGTLLASLSTAQVFVLVWLAGTLTACLVTLWTVKKELGVRTALALAGRQALTSIASALLFATVLRLL